MYIVLFTKKLHCVFHTDNIFKLIEMNLNPQNVNNKFT